MQECPVCKDGIQYTSKGVWIHIGRKARTDDAHRKYRDSNQPRSDIDALLDDLSVRLAEGYAKKEYPQAPSLEREPVVPVYKETSAPKQQKKRIIRRRRVKSGNLEGRRPGLLSRLRRKKSEKDVKLPEVAKEEKDPENILEIITKIPAVTAVLIIFYKVLTDYKFFIKWMDTDMGELYLYVLAHPSESGSIIVLVFTALTVSIILLLVHRLVWRLFFKDMQIRFYRKDPNTGAFIPVGTSREGRIFLTIGRGRLDGLYRRITKKPKPEVVTLYFKTRGFVNPFKVLASCEKGYIQDPEGKRFVVDGLFRRTLIATHKRRDTENDSVVYWFCDSRYDKKAFDSKFYEESLYDEIKEGAGKVTKASALDSTVQKAQMEQTIAWLPRPIIDESRKVYEKMKEKGLLRPER